MKKNGKKIAVMLLLAVIAVGSYLVSGVYAKYTKTLEGSDTATVAKFSVSSNALTPKAEDNQIELFKTIKDDNLTSAEGHVAENLIAPGTGGSFQVDLTNKSEVDVKAEIKITETNASNIPIEYSTDEGDTKTWKPAGEFTKTVDQINKGNNTSNVTIYWRWAYERTTEGADVADTAIGEYDKGETPTPAAPQVTATVAATFTQLD